MFESFMKTFPITNVKKANIIYYLHRRTADPDHQTRELSRVQ